MSNVPLVSVLMPAYCREQYIGEAIASILSQTFAGWELIVVDDGSDDGTAAVVDGVADARVRLLRQKHLGIGAALNAGLAVARGELVARLDSDDIWLPEMLETQLAALEKGAGVGLAYARGQAMDAGGRPMRDLWGVPLSHPDDAFRSMLLGDSTCNITVVVRRASLDRAGPFDESMRTNEDWDMWLRVARQRCRFVFTDRVLARFRRHEGQISEGPTRDADRADRVKVLDKLFQDPTLPAEIRALRGLAYSNVATGNGLVWLVERKYRLAAGSFTLALGLSPRPLMTAVRIAWFSLRWRILDRSSWGRPLADGVTRILHRLRAARRNGPKQSG